MSDAIAVGIDTGLDGGFVVLNPDGKVILQAQTPTLAGKGSRQLFNVRAMRQLLEPFEKRRVLVGLEKSQAMPAQGVSSMWSTGYGFGIWEGLLCGMEFAYETPTPQAWQKALFQGVMGEGKTRSIIAAQRLLPDLDLMPGRLRKPHDGLADAALIALYMRRRDRGEK